MTFVLVGSRVSIGHLGEGVVVLPTAPEALKAIAVLSELAPEVNYSLYVNGSCVLRAIGERWRVGVEA